MKRGERERERERERDSREWCEDGERNGRLSEESRRQI